jgi:hypothetical protein
VASSVSPPSGAGQAGHFPGRPGQPPAAPAPPAKLRPARAWYWVALVAFLAGAGWLGGGLYLLDKRVDSFQRVALPGEGEVSLDHSGGYVIYYEGPGAEAGNVPAFTVNVTPRSASAAVPYLEQYESSLTYSFGSREGRAVFTLQVASPGTFLIEATDGPATSGDSSLAIGSSIAGRIVGIAVPGAVLMVAAIGVAIAVAIVRRRRRALPVRRRDLVAALLAVLLVFGIAWWAVSVAVSGSASIGTSGPKDQPTTTQEVPAVREGEIIFQDDFSNSASGWETAVFDAGELGYVEGAYRIVAEQAELQLRSNLELSDLEVSRVQGLRLEFEATQLAGTSGDFVGARCYTDVGSNTGYIVGIGPADAVIAAFRGDDYRPLKSSGERIEAVRRPGEENQLRVECVASPDAPIVLTLEANGEALVRAEDEERTRGFDAFGLFVDTTEGGAEALFDDIVVTELVPK